MREHHHYLQAEALGLVNGSRLIPRLLGRRPRMRLGLLLEDIPGPDLDHLLARACGQDEADPLYRGLEKLARLLAFFHTRPLQAAPASPFPALAYFAKLRRQLGELKLLSPEDEEALDTERWAWEARLTELPDCLVLVHGDATPTNFLFPDGRAVAIDLERLGAGDRLWDLSWVAGELKHAWGWRTGQMDRAEPFIRHFFAAYLAALPRDRGPAFRVRRLNPFYMALAELRIARNAYLTWDYRLALIKEARRCLFYGRRF
jgi:aminoglycoside phosphotransferase